MPASYSMSWEPRTRRWRKMTHGRTYVVSVRQLKRAGYLPADAAETKEATYRAARQWWLEHGTKARGPRPDLPPYHPHESEIRYAERRRDWYRRSGDEDAARREEERISAVRRLGPDDPVPVDDDTSERLRTAEALGGEFPPDASTAGLRIALGADSVWAQRFRADDPDTAPVGRTIATWVDRYLDMVMSRYQAKEISAAEYQATRSSLHAFRDWSGPGTGIETLDPDAWERWWHHLLKSAYSTATKKKRLGYARVFIRWLASRAQIPLPPNLTDRRLRFNEGPPSVSMPDLAEIRRVLNASTGQLRLHLLLMLNCGMTQIDLANLRQDEVDWERGRVNRKRSKTKSRKSVPTVEYPLWAETWALLKRFREPSGDLVLRTHSGKPWVRDEIDAGGKRHKTDQIRTNYGHLRLKLKASMPLSALRKVGSTLLADDPRYSAFAQRFLGHAPTSIAERHYIGNQAGQGTFDEAVRWIETMIGLSS